MKQKPLEMEPESGQDVEALRLEGEEFKQEEERIRVLRQEKEEQLRTIIYTEMINK